MAELPIPVRSAPGIQRDGTTFDGNHYIDGRWCRFNRGRPRKMLGYRAASTLPELVRGMRVDSSNGSQYVHAGGATTLTQSVLDAGGLLSAQNDRTPSGLVDNPNNLWQYGVMFDSVTSAQVLIAHAAPNLSAIDSTVETDLYIGSLTASTALTDMSVAEESGGIVVISPYLFKFGNAGHVAWSVANEPTDFVDTGSGDAFITGQKIVRGLEVRGGNRPAGIFWSLDSLIQGVFVGGTAIWDFNTITAESSILSSQGVIEYDSIYYWVGVDRFLTFNGVVRELPNPLNSDFFFDNLNYAQRQKVFAYKVPRFGEIWWCFPFGNATECNHAVVYNVRENTWYDTPLPDGGRCAGYFTKVYNKPFMIDVDLTSDDLYTLWQHETGLDRIDGSSVLPISSHFETHEVTLMDNNPPDSKSLRIARMEPDFVQSGDLEVEVRGRSNPRSPTITSDPVTIPETASSSEEQTTPLREIRRLMGFKFTSNTTGGNYQMGKTIAHIAPADGRINQ